MKGKSKLTRKQLEHDPEFKQAFYAAKARVELMEWQWVEITDPDLQCLFEFYAAITLQSEFNDFENH